LVRGEIKRGGWHDAWQLAVSNWQLAVGKRILRVLPPPTSVGGGKTLMKKISILQRRFFSS